MQNHNISYKFFVQFNILEAPLYIHNLSQVLISVDFCDREEWQAKFVLSEPVGNHDI